MEKAVHKGQLIIQTEAVIKEEKRQSQKLFYCKQYQYVTQNHHLNFKIQEKNKNNYDMRIKILKDLIKIVVNRVKD